MADCNGGKRTVGSWTRERVEALGMVCDVETAAQILGIGRTVAYRLAREGDFPTPIRKIGGQYRVLVRGLLDFLDGAELEPVEAVRAQ
ncbi:helix-turn-helix domain-containing protein [Glycomyces buryatensis]|uniref:Helix-turn-helix domain-containing protein n=1 Tax=Glycomyces buryatensis TaxID=2570927 RepID=A0A4S8QMR2_9ACTN|nr:helix-turn-helix domain-containing protein [Glycomyces buryatensis]THV42014.1 helix-turn-helix domain-containing protein [Glycomyces buryatensis]